MVCVLICNIAAYKFISLDFHLLPNLCTEIKAKATQLKMKGTIFLSVEGINLFLVGQQEHIENFQKYLADNPYFNDLKYKYSYSTYYPFKKLIVKIKKEIVSFGVSEIHPEETAAPYLTPETFKQWYDEKREIMVLDVRNQFEFEMGSFDSAIHLGINNFRDFPKVIDKLSAIKSKPVVTFCTGGIRCEKAALLLLRNGFKKVYQLQGGILNYFEHCGNAHFHGDCFVFDDRIALSEKLEPVKS
jgi:UPF0176 protein